MKENVSSDIVYFQAVLQATDLIETISSSLINNPGTELADRYLTLLRLVWTEVSSLTNVLGLGNGQKEF